MLDDGGTLTLFEADPSGYKELAKSKVCGSTWAHPALVEGRVYLRDEKELICVPVSDSSWPIHSIRKPLLRRSGT